MTLLDYALIAAALLGVALAVLARRDAAQAWLRSASERAGLLRLQRQTESDLEAARRQVDALGEAALDGLLLLDADRHVLWGSSAAWEVLAAGQPAIGRPFITVAKNAELNQAVRDAQSGRRTVVRQAAVGERVVRIRAVPFEDGRSIAVAVEDITELQRLGRARRDLVANLSHELRTPIASILLAAQTLHAAAFDDRDLTRRMLDHIESYAQTLSQLSQEMMDLAQIESGQVLLKLVPVALEPLAQQALHLLQQQAVVKNQAVTLAIPDDMLVLADEQQVIRVITNLLHNAIKFTPEGGKIQVSAGAAGEEDVQLCVQDTGPGVPAAEQSRVFERFYKADRARNRGGTGLGLAIARHIVEGHGGRIWVESAPGQGAKFCFTLPKA